MKNLSTKLAAIIFLLMLTQQKGISQNVVIPGAGINWRLGGNTGVWAGSSVFGTTFNRPILELAFGESDLGSVFRNRSSIRMSPQQVIIFINGQTSLQLPE
jgi:hypothetical protein